MDNYTLPRRSGILLHPTSLPSPYGIGDLGAKAYEFVDFLQASGQHLWQILPLTHTGYGDSPYQSFSAFAGQPLLISPVHLLELQLIEADDLKDCPTDCCRHIDYGSLIPWKMQLLQRAFSNFWNRKPSELMDSFENFCLKNLEWLDDYSLFMACKKANNGVSWLQWENSYRIPTPEFKEHLHQALTSDINFYRFIQFIFFEEWYALKNYANQRGIQIIGDIPIFVSMDSADVWANQSLFQLDENGFPLRVAGVPPDYFSETGQLWGNPLYRWEAHEKDTFSWWIARIRNQLNVLDILRIDHFRGFEAYWSVPYGEETAVNGTWIKGPGSALFTAIEHALGEHLPIIAEDLGVITPQVEALRDAFHFPGMKVLQFAFETTGESDFLPHRYRNTNCVCYTGTHDNDTTRGWFETLRPECRFKVTEYLNIHAGELVSQSFIRACLSSVAAYAIFPLQDLLNCGKDGRMNVPGVAGGNWDWRFEDGLLTEELAGRLKELSLLYGR